MADPDLIRRCQRCGTANRVPADKAHRRARCGRCGTPLETGPTRPLSATEGSFDTDVLRSPLPVLVDCWAAWCGPCRALEPVIEALAERYAGRVRVVKVDVDDSPGIASRYGVQGIPALLFFSDGRLVDRMVGLQPRQAIEERLEQVLAGANRST
jgi:thioredoxin 2